MPVAAAVPGYARAEADEEAAAMVRRGVSSESIAGEREREVGVQTQSDGGRK